MVDNSKVWMGMIEISDKMLLGKVKPNMSLVEEALSFDASRLDSILIVELRKYIVVLGQYLITLQFEENRTEAESSAWSKALDAHMYMVMRDESSAEFKAIKTLAEKKAWILDGDLKAGGINSEYLVADAKKKIVKNMCKPVEQYINALKKEIDARTSERRKSYE